MNHDNLYFPKYTKWWIHYANTHYDPVNVVNNNATAFRCSAQFSSMKKSGSIEFLWILKFQFIKLLKAGNGITRDDPGF